MHTRCSQALKIKQLTLFVAHQHRLGNLNHQFIRRHATGVEGRQPIHGDIFIIKLTWRAVDGNSEIEAGVTHDAPILEDLRHDKLT
nr:hypothetical protein [Pseudidiomarina aquimaris]